MQKHAHPTGWLRLKVFGEPHRLLGLYEDRYYSFIVYWVFCDGN